MVRLPLSYGAGKGHCGAMRLFRLVRKEDVSGVSGVGIVAEGVCFGNGKVAMAWIGKHHTIELFDYMEEVEELHGHEGRTVVEWIVRDDGRI